jgi:hypothetical protein
MSQTFEELLTVWQKTAAEAKRLATEERKLRDALCAAAFPKPTEGVNKRELVDGRIFKMTHKINRSVDEAAIPAMREALAKATNEVTFDDIFKTKIDLQVGPYKKLAPELLVIVNEAVVSKPGAPTIEVI